MRELEPLELKVGRRYVTESGMIAVILKNDARGSQPVFGYLIGTFHDYYAAWTKEGVFDIHNRDNNSNAIVAEVSGADLEARDDPWPDSP